MKIVKSGPQRFFVDANGVYLGSFCGVLDGNDNEVRPTVPEGSVEVTSAPIDGRQRFNLDLGVWTPFERPYDEARASEYPALGDQLDAIWKELNHRRSNGEVLTPDANSMLDKVLAVKTKYPKP